MVSVLTQSGLFEKTVSNLVEVGKPWSLSDGGDHLWQLQHRGYGGFHHLCAEDRRTFHHDAGDHHSAAAWLLCERGQGTGCG